MPSVVQLEYVLAVHRTGHFGRAAEACHVAQPTLSAQIQKVESELGVVLFDRAQRPIVATPQGERLIAHAQEVVAAHERLMWEAMDESREPAGRFALGVIPTLAAYVIPWFLERFAKKYPRVELSLVERPTDALIDDMLHQRIDAAILATPLGEPSIIEQVLFYDPFYLYAHERDPVLKRREIDSADLIADKIWLLEDGHCVRSQVINFCGLRASHAFFESVSFAAGSFETLRYVIDAVGGYTLIPETFARVLPRSVRQHNVRPFGDTSPVREVSLVHPRSSWKGRILEALHAALIASTPRSLRQVSAGGEILSIRTP